MLLTILPINKKIHVEKGENLYNIIRNYGVDLGVCSGNRTCRKCKVLITKGNTLELSKEELNCLGTDEIKRGIRLACCFLITEDTTIILMNKIKPYETKVNQYTINENYISKEANELDLTHQTTKQYGVVIDIGTTTVEAILWDTVLKRMIASIKVANPQSVYGKDVISRITFSNKSKDNQNTLTKMIRTCCNDIIKEMVEKNNIVAISINKVVIAANTTMTQLFCGNSVEGLGYVPIRNINYEAREYLGFEVDMPFLGQAHIYVMPSIGGHVGSDTLACIIGCDLHEKKEKSLLVDIGTNGEITLSIDGNILVCSTAAGPAFEGATLSYGMGAVEGAIYSVQYKRDNFTLKVIGEKHNTKALGICGSGVVEAVYEFYANGIMDDTGRLLGEYSINNSVALYKDKEREVLITQKDIREIQLAKGAIYAGIMILLKTYTIHLDEIEAIYIAGAFGSNMNIYKAMGIGLIPRLDENKVHLIGNGALQGATKILLGDMDYEGVEKVKLRCKHIDLALSEDFQEEFINALSFH